MFWRNAAKIAVFTGFCQDFGLHMVYSTAVTINMTRYKTQKKSYVKKSLSQENKKKLRW